MNDRELFAWSDSYNVGIQEVDEQHQVLVSCSINCTKPSAKHHGKATSREILDRLAEIPGPISYSKKALMRLTHYPGSISKQQHEELIHQVRDLQHKLDHENVNHHLRVAPLPQGLADPAHQRKRQEVRGLLRNRRPHPVRHLVRKGDHHEEEEMVVEVW